MNDGSLIVESFVFLVLHSIHARKTGKSIWLMRVQRSDNGRLLVINSLFTFVLLAFVAAWGRQPSWKLSLGQTLTCHT